MKKNSKKPYRKPIMRAAIISTPSILAGSPPGSIEAGGTDGNGDHSIPADAKESIWSFDIDE